MACTKLTLGLGAHSGRLPGKRDGEGESESARTSRSPRGRTEAASRLGEPSTHTWPGDRAQEPEEGGPGKGGRLPSFTSAPPGLPRSLSGTPRPPPQRHPGKVAPGAPAARAPSAHTAIPSGSRGPGQRDFSVGGRGERPSGKPRVASSGGGARRERVESLTGGTWASRALPERICGRRPCL